MEQEEYTNENKQHKIADDGYASKDNKSLKPERLENRMDKQEAAGMAKEILEHNLKQMVDQLKVSKELSMKLKVAKITLNCSLLKSCTSDS